MKPSIFSLLLMLLLPAIGRAHGGEDHSKAAPATVGGATYFSAETLTDKYEFLVTYQPIIPGQPARLQLYISDAATNHPVKASQLQVTIPQLPNTQVKLTYQDSGMYTMETNFPEAGSLDLQIQMAAAQGPDLALLKGISPGKTIQASEEPSAWYSSKWLLAGLAFGAGLGVALVLRRKPGKAKATAICLCLALLPPALVQQATAHGGEDHGATPAGSTTTASANGTLLVPKQTQFLFQLYTQAASKDSFATEASYLGTVVAGPQGMAQLQTPQTGRIVKLLVQPGQQVRKGQTLLVVEQQVEASAQLNILSQRNQLAAELLAAQQQYQRLQSIADIAAGRDLSEARARYETAKRNLSLYSANAGSMGTVKQMNLSAPIAGTVGNFSYALGAVVQPGQTILEITNLNDLFVEVQQFGQETTTQQYTAYLPESSVGIGLRRVTSNLPVNTTNQSERVLMKVTSQAQALRPGQNVQVQANARVAPTGPTIPLSAITDVNGKPAVFVKNHAEEFQLRMVRVARQNPQMAMLEEGIAVGEKIVNHNVYQMKMIYLGQ